MVRRLKDDLRKLEGGFPVREVVEVPISGLAGDNAELVLPQLLDEYRQAREERLKDAAKSVQAASALVLCSLQKRLLSSIEAFACTLKVHRDAFEAHARKVAESKLDVGLEARANLAQLKLLTSPNVLRAINPRHNPTQDTLNRLLRPFKLRLTLAPSSRRKDGARPDWW